MLKRMRIPAAAAALALVAGTAGGQAIISNGTVKLGINAQGHLNNAGVGLRYITPAREYESTSDGCECEGWGVGVRSGGVVTSWGGANDAVGGVTNLTNIGFTSDASSATSTVRLTSGATLQISHEYKPSSVPNLYEVNITITNTGAATIDDVVYRRVMDWDIQPTAFSENVRISGWGATNLIGAGDNGFLSAQPLSMTGSVNGCTIAGSSAVCNGNFETSVSRDRGSFFDFSFGALAAGESRAFQTFYGAAGTLDGLLAALGSVGAEVYTAAWCAGGSSACSGKAGPGVFGYGFKGVGGTKPPELPGGPSVVPEPSTYALLATGLVGLVGISRRRRNVA
ncbi:MAG: PEP-CTERM sorting domain-containing protein [Gemmatimonadaceae bacterium]|nr:PEP-CTERM sorting domain-containing protein [Gemmatimonadaceae bacterium]